MKKNNIFFILKWLFKPIWGIWCRINIILMFIIILIILYKLTIKT